MKKHLLFVFALLLAINISAEVVRTQDVTTPGTLATLAGSYLSTVTNLTVTGIIDARDFKTMRDKMPLLAKLDLSGANIMAYTGTEATNGTSSTAYPANTIPACAFYVGSYPGKASLTQVKMPLSTSSIGRSAFRCCHGLSGISIPSSVTSIGDYAFNDCTGLTSVTIPSSVTIVGSYAFYSCSKLTAINVESNNLNYSSLNGVLFNKTQTTLIQYPNGKAGSYSIPSSVASIGESAFYLCSGLTSVTVPSSVTSIGHFAFWDCTGLASVTIPASVTSVGNFAFYNCGKLKAINVESDNLNYSSPDGVLFNKGQTTLIQYPKGKVGVNYSIPSLVTSIEDLAFYGCTGLTSVTIPSSVKSIGESAFSYCTGLTSVTIPSSVTSIGLCTFNFCSGLTSVAIPLSVTSIGNYAFLCCSGLTSVKIPSSVTSIGYSAFSDCTSLRSVYADGPTPVDLTTAGDVFGNVNKTTCTLYVPAGSKALYQAASQWKDFKNIVEVAVNAIPSLSDESVVRIYPNPASEAFRITGINETAKLQILDLNGKVVLSKQVKDKESVSIGTLAGGVYVVKLSTNGNVIERKLIKR